MIKQCMECGKRFEISGAEMDYYEKNELEVPKCCLPCRQANRMKINESAIPRGKARRKNRRAVMKAVSPTVLLVLIVLTFLFIRVVRDSDDNNSSKMPSNVQEAVLFRSEKLMNEHYEKHGKQMGFSSAEEYLAGANATINNSTAICKTQEEDGDKVYYVESTNDLVIVSTDGFIRTYFRPEERKEYFERQ